MMAGDDDAISGDQLRKAMMWHENLINLAGGSAAVHRFPLLMQLLLVLLLQLQGLPNQTRP